MLRNKIKLKSMRLHLIWKITKNCPRPVTNSLFTRIYNSTIQTGYSPFYLPHGFKPKPLVDIALVSNSLGHSIIEQLQNVQKVRDTIPEALKKAFENQKKNKFNVNFYAGEKLLVIVPVRKNQFANRYDGPFTVLKRSNNNAYLINLSKNVKLMNVPIHVHIITDWKMY